MSTLLHARFLAVTALGTALAALSIACGGSAPAAPAPPAAGAPAALATLPPPPVTTSGRKEVAQVLGPRKRLGELYTALQKKDFPAAHAALEAYNGEWNGIEVYVNVRSRALYGEIETHYEADITTGLESAAPNTEQLTTLLKGMVEQYDQAVKLSDTGPAISPLFEDLAVVRTVRIPLRPVAAALKAGDVAKAKAGVDGFKAAWPQAQPYFKARSADAFAETDAALSAADKALGATPVGAAAAPLIDTLVDRFNYGVNLVNAAARGADIAKTAFTPQDVAGAAALTGMMQDVRDSLAAWESANFAAATTAATRAAGERFTVVAAPLQAKAGADAAVKKALDAYVALAGQAGDATKVKAAGKAAIEAAALAQQTLAGQFWTDQKFKEALQAAH